MKVCFVGIGSIATRHIYNLIELVPDVHIDALHHEKKNNSDVKGSNQNIYNHYYDAADLPNDYDVIFITNPTVRHYDTLLSVHDKAKHFFIEKPVFFTGDENIELLKQREGSVYYVACPLRYTQILQTIKNEIDFANIYSMRCISSSYLPDWRPGIDYRGNYSAKKELGGGVELDLIHEWDYITWLIGMPKCVKSIVSHKSVLEIDSNDIALYIAEYENHTVEIHLDYFGRQTIRKLELFGKNDFIDVDLINNSIEWSNSKRVIKFNEARDDYQSTELKEFLEIIRGNRKNGNDIKHAYDVLRIARGIR